MLNPIKSWSKPLRVSEVAIDRNRPPSATGLVYLVGGGPDPDKDIRYLGSAHASDATDGLERIGTLIGAMLGFELYHSGGIKLAKNYSLDEIANFYVMWALISGCPILAERELRNFHLTSGQSPKFLHGGEPKRNAVCKKICIPKRLGWTAKP